MVNHRTCAECVAIAASLAQRSDWPSLTVRRTDKTKVCRFAVLNYFGSFIYLFCFVFTLWALIFLSGEKKLNSKPFSDRSISSEQHREGEKPT